MELSKSQRVILISNKLQFYPSIGVETHLEKVQIKKKISNDIKLMTKQQQIKQVFITDEFGHID